MAVTSADTRPDERYDIRIKRDGSWWHEGDPIRRMELVKLFATALRRDAAGDHWLITPAERGRVTVDDTPFIIVEMVSEGAGPSRVIKFRTNLDEWVTAGPEHPIMGVDEDVTGGGAPKVAMRDGLEARISRAVYYDLVALCEPVANDLAGDLSPGRVGVWSDGAFFILGAVEETGE